MPYYAPPNSDSNRRTTIDRAIKTGTDNAALGEQHISPQLLADLTAFAPLFAAATQAVTILVGERMQEVQESERSLELVKVYLRELWETVRRRVRRMGLPTAVYHYYHMSAEGVSPKPTTRGEWLTLADDVIAGHTAALAAGYNMVTDPTTAEIQAVLDAAKKEAGKVDKADHAVDKAQAHLAELRVRADELIRELYEELRFNLRKLDPPSQRRTMRSYGLRFYYSPGEPTDPDDTPLPTE